MELKDKIDQLNKSMILYLSTSNEDHWLDAVLIAKQREELNWQITKNITI